MSHYNQLIKGIAKSIKTNSHATVVMDYGTQKVIARGKNARSVVRKTRASKDGGKLPIVLGRPKANAIWILANS
jgi:hypothetical protein